MSDPSKTDGVDPQLPAHLPRIGDLTGNQCISSRLVAADAEWASRQDVLNAALLAAMTRAVVAHYDMLRTRLETAIKALDRELAR